MYLHYIFIHQIIHFLYQSEIINLGNLKRLPDTVTTGVKILSKAFKQSLAK